MTLYESQVEARWPGLLTPAQREAVALLEAGYSHRAAARALGISQASYRDRLDAAERRITAAEKGAA